MGNRNYSSWNDTEKGSKQVIHQRKVLRVRQGIKAQLPGEFLPSLEGRWIFQNTEDEIQGILKWQNDPSENMAWTDFISTFPHVHDDLIDWDDIHEHAFKTSEHLCYSFV